MDSRDLAAYRLSDSVRRSDPQYDQNRGEGLILGARTDLAVEARDMVAGDGAGQISGVVSEEEQGQYSKTVVVRVQTDEGARILGKRKGLYVTIETENLKNSQKQAKDEVATTLGRHIRSMLAELGVTEDQEVLVAGLGNWKATPDAVGPSVVGKLLVTRHLRNFVPPEKQGSLRPVSALSPGVLGITGIETAEILSSVVERTQPAAVIVIDALASRSVSRIGSSVQIGNTGIHPGSGVGNRRNGIDRESLGVPVLAIGVPTVVDAVTIISDAVDLLSPQESIGGDHGVSDMRKTSLAKALGPQIGSMVVTPKEIDVIVEVASTVVAGGLNTALHPGLSEEEIYEYLN